MPAQITPGLRCDPVAGIRVLIGAREPGHEESSSSCHMVPVLIAVAENQKQKQPSKEPKR
jgi:hypothetical protein